MNFPDDASDWAEGSAEFDSVAAVGVLLVEDRFLVIKRSDLVIAPGKVCFPGGTIETGESIPDALQREFREEVGLDVQPLREVYRSITSWRCKVHWWRVECDQDQRAMPNCLEVSSIDWQTMEQLLGREDLLESNRHFLESVLGGEINL